MIKGLIKKLGERVTKLASHKTVDGAQETESTNKGKNNMKAKTDKPKVSDLRVKETVLGSGERQYALEIYSWDDYSTYEPRWIHYCDQELHLETDDYKSKEGCIAILQRIEKRWRDNAIIETNIVYP